MVVEEVVEPILDLVVLLLVDQVVVEMVLLTLLLQLVEVMNLGVVEVPDIKHLLLLVPVDKVELEVMV
jgi:hypothetical protein